MLSTQSRRLFGRKVIYTEETEIHEGNILDVLQKAFITHSFNRADIDYLYWYRRGKQPILDRTKEVRPEINNTIVENRADEIVSFKTGYHLGEPILYVSQSDAPGIKDEVDKLNSYMRAEDKHSKDKELEDWFNVCGTSYRIALPDAMANVEEDEAPFEIYTLDPRNTFIVYSVELGHKPMLAVSYICKEDGTIVFSCYSRDRFFLVENTWKIIYWEYQLLGIPIIEYRGNNEMLGAFETVIPLLDAINMTESNRVDGVEQFIQALMLFHNVDISSEDFGKLKDLGAIKYKDIDPQLKAEIEYLTSEMNQAQTQTLVDHMYNTVLTICGMPNRNGGSSTSDTGKAVIYRDGWSAAEARAKASDQMFRKAENEFLKLVLRICRDMAGLSLKLSALEIRFTRRDADNTTEKANVFVALAESGKVALEDVYVISGLFSDPQASYKRYLEWRDNEQARLEKQAQKALANGEETLEEVKEDGETD